MTVQRRERTDASTGRRARPGNVLTLRICGMPLTVAGLPRALRERFRALMRPFEDNFDPSSATHHLEVRRAGSEMIIVRDDEVAAAYGDTHLLLTQLEWHAVTAALETTETYLPLHGATLARDNRAVLLLAESGSGKTTLTLGLMRRGWQPLADDITLVDLETLAIQPFPRCFHVDDNTRSLAINEDLIEWPGSVRGYARPLQWAESQQRLHAILLVDRCPTCPSRLRGLTLAEAAAAIGNNAIRGRLARSQVAQTAVRMAIGANSGGRLSNGNLEDALDLIESVCLK